MTLLSFKTKEGEDNMCCAVAQHVGSSTVIVGRENGTLSVYDLQRTSRLLLEASVGYQSVLKLKLVNNLLACGTSLGSISLRDPRAGLAAEAVIQSHAGPIVGMDTQGELVACAGMNMFRGQLVSDTLVKVFDVRKAHQPVANVPFGPGVAALSFHPHSAGLLLLSSGTGVSTFVEIANLDEPAWFHVNCEGDTLTTAEFLPSGEGMVFADTGGVAHLWGVHSAPKVRQFGESLDPAAAPSKLSRFQSISETDSFTSLEFPTLSAVCLSSFNGEEEALCDWGPRVVDETLYKNSRKADFVHYSPNPHYRRNITFRAVSKATANLRNKRQVGHKVVLEGKRPRRKSHLPPIYRNIEIPQSFKRIRNEEFDVSFYNQTGFAGLENGMANCYANPLLQVLFFLRKFRDYAQQEKWLLNYENEFSLTSELGYLFHMMSICPRDHPCQATNFLRALRHLKQAGLLGLLEAERGVPGSGSELETAKDKSLPMRIQSLCRFLIEQLGREENQVCGSCTVQHLFGMNVKSEISCLTGSYPSTRKSFTSYVLDLKYPPALSSNKASCNSFIEVLRQSLHVEQEMKAWFEPAGGYMLVHQVKSVYSMPKYVFMNCNIRSEREMHLWAVGHKTSKESGKFWPAETLYFQEDQDRNEAIKVSDRPGDLSPHGRSRVNAYELMSLIAFSADEELSSFDKVQDVAGHLVAHVRVGEGIRSKELGTPEFTINEAEGSSSKEDEGKDTPSETESAAIIANAMVQLKQENSDDSNWVLFNDFSINPTTRAEPRELYGLEKIPCLLVYRQTPAPGAENECNAETPSASTVLAESYEEVFTHLVDAPPLNENLAKTPYTFTKLDLNEEMPGPKMLLGIDAEFVALSAEEKGEGPSGCEEVIRPPRLGLARVSVVRGSGPLKFVPCIDDHIQTLEPVYDYLTQYSGVQPGDLHANKSTHYLTTLRCAYIKLRFLIDKGCIFIGHGLKKDMRMINIVIPPENVVDTVDLFHLKPQRRLSLKFLAAYFLGEDVQVEEHDSIEDACAAIKLFDKYQELERAGRVKDTLIELYHFGRTNNWDVEAALNRKGNDESKNAYE